jgi:hypothetical protein
VLLICLAGQPGGGGRGELVGLVDKVENEAQIASGAQTATAVVGAKVHMRDELRTGANGRLKVTLRDGTVLTLGENATVAIDRYAFDPDRGVGEALLTTTEDAFRFVTGRIKQLKDKTITVSTPAAQLGVRGTEFWGGPIDETYEVLLLDGEITVSNQAGSVTLSTPGQGTDIPSPLEGSFRLVGRQDRARRGYRGAPLTSPKAILCLLAVFSWNFPVLRACLVLSRLRSQRVRAHP